MAKKKKISENLTPVINEEENVIVETEEVDTPLGEKEPKEEEKTQTPTANIIVDEAKQI